MMSAAVVSSLRVFLTREAMTSSGVAPEALISGIIETPVSNPDSPSTRADQPDGVPSARDQPLSPAADQRRFRGEVDKPCHHDGGVEQQVDCHQGYRDPYSFIEAQQEDPTQDQQQNHGDDDGAPFEGFRDQWVLQQMHCRIRTRECDRDDPRGRNEAEEQQDEELSAAERQQLLQHPHRTLPVGAFLRDPAVHGQHAQQRQGHDQQGGQWRQGPGGQGCNTGQIGQGGKVVDAGQAHDFPPRVGLVVFLGFRACRSDLVCEQPTDQGLGVRAGSLLQVDLGRDSVAGSGRH
ncbi:MAG: hypothetical protein NVS2B15_24320 [Pseudarthrobacter sp.]